MWELTFSNTLRKKNPRSFCLQIFSPYCPIFPGKSRLYAQAEEDDDLAGMDTTLAYSDKVIEIEDDEMIGGRFPALTEKSWEPPAPKKPSQRCPSDGREVLEGFMLAKGDGSTKQYWPPPTVPRGVSLSPRCAHIFWHSLCVITVRSSFLGGGEGRESCTPRAIFVVFVHR